ncbi:hypothetical protein DL93DRAFT_1751813 [Clavulina sp. PMI_390]|nr:hypothetical protein DL93DRAFT_1751813 [Clavulina sp. PMI_390]
MKSFLNSTPSPRARLIAPQSSLLDASLSDSIAGDDALLYTFVSNPQKRTTTLNRSTGEQVALVSWARPVYDSSTGLCTTSDVSVLFEGDKTPIEATELLFASNLRGSKRQFRSAGYADPFKWKKSTSHSWQCFTSTRALLASLHLSSDAGISLEIYNHTSRTLSNSSSGSTPQNTPEQSLQDSLVLTSLLLTTPSTGSQAPVEPKASSSFSLRKHASMPKLRSKSSVSKLPSFTRSHPSQTSSAPTPSKRSLSSSKSTNFAPSTSSSIPREAREVAAPSASSLAKKPSSSNLLAPANTTQFSSQSLRVPSSRFALELPRWEQDAAQEFEPLVVKGDASRRTSDEATISEADPRPSLATSSSSKTPRTGAVSAPAAPPRSSISPSPTPSAKSVLMLPTQSRPPPQSLSAPPRRRMRRTHSSSTLTSTPLPTPAQLPSDLPSAQDQQPPRASTSASSKVEVDDDTATLINRPPLDVPEMVFDDNEPRSKATWGWGAVLESRDRKFARASTAQALRDAALVI